MSNPEVYIVSAVRTAIGSFGGTLKDTPLLQLATTAVQAALLRSGCAAEQIGHVVMGNVIPTAPQDGYVSRVAAINSGIPQETPAFNVNRLCGSGLQAIISAAQSLLLGDTDIAIGGGVESMSRAPYILPGARWGGRLGDMQAVDYMLGILHDPIHHIHMGITAENISARHGISREAQDALALESQQRATQAIAKGYFLGQIVPVEVQTRKGIQLFEVDEHVRTDTSLDQLARMKPGGGKN